MKFKIIIVFTCLVFVLSSSFSISSKLSGYEETINWWRGVVSETEKYQDTLQNLYAQVEEQLGPNKKQLNQNFTKQLNENYPGSTFYGTSGRLAINNYTNMTFDARWNINVLTQQLGGLSKTYNLKNSVFEVTNGPNRIKFQLNLAQPGKSQFILAEIPAISASAHRIWGLKGIKQGIFQPLKDILNDFYAYRFASEGIRMDMLAEQILEQDATRQHVLKAAEELYLQKNIALSSVQQTPPSVVQYPARNHTVESFNIFSLLPWFFWPGLIGLIVLKAIISGRGSWSFARFAYQAFQATGREIKGRGKNGRGYNFTYDGVRTDTSRAREEWIRDDFYCERPKPKEWSLEVISSLEWRRFETLCADYLSLIGLIPKETRIGADGGVDIWVYKEGIEKPVGIVQCKAWSTYKVGVKPVRELFGVMAAEGVVSGKFITSGSFTNEAIAFAQGKKLSLISGEKLLASIRKLSAESQKFLLDKALEGDYTTPSCPQCGVRMVVRKGKNSDREFWGCPKYPRCRATLVYKAN